MRLTIVGCSGLFPTAASLESSYLVEAKDAQERTWRLLLDLGSGTVGPLQNYVSLPSLDAVLVSNLDLDHCADLWSLYVALYYYASPRPSHLPLYGPPGIASRLVAIGDPRSADGVPEIFDISEWSNRSSVSVGPVIINPYRVNHPGPAFGLRLEDGNSVIAYTGDTDSCPALSVLADRADLLLADATFEERHDQERNIHMTGSRAGELAADAKVRRLVLTHLSPWADSEVILTEARASYAGQLQIAEAGRVYSINE